MTQTALPPSPSALRAEHHLARYWDTLGYTLDREHKDGTVYLLAAWTLDPLAFYGSHLGRDYEHAHMDADAIAIYRQAQNAEGSADMKQTIADRLAALAGPPKPAPASAPAGPVAHAVAAVFYTAGGKPQVRFLTGADAVGDAGATTADQAATMWKLPDSGPEQVVRLVAIDCGGTGGCTSSNLPAHLP